MINNVSGQSAAILADSAATKPAGADSAVNKETFLQLLVAQIKNQNPLNPADGVQFLTQLAQFTELEQMMGIRGEIAALREQLKQNKTETGGNKPDDQNTSGANHV